MNGTRPSMARHLRDSSSRSRLEREMHLTGHQWRGEAVGSASDGRLCEPDRLSYRFRHRPGMESLTAAQSLWVILDFAFQVPQIIVQLSLIRTRAHFYARFWIHSQAKNRPGASFLANIAFRGTGRSGSAHHQEGTVWSTRASQPHRNSSKGLGSQGLPKMPIVVKQVHFTMDVIGVACDLIKVDVDSQAGAGRQFKVAIFDGWKACDQTEFPRGVKLFKGFLKP